MILNDTNVHVGQVDCYFCYKKLLHSICDHFFFLSFFINGLSEVASKFAHNSASICFFPSFALLAGS